MMDKKEAIKNFFGYLLPAVLCFLVIWIWNPFQLAVYSLLIALFLYAVSGVRYVKRWQLNSRNLRRYFSYAGIVYLMVIALFSLSPLLRLTEFQLWHGEYKIVKGEIYLADTGVYRQRGNLYGFADVDYIYEVSGKSYKQQQKAAVRFYSFPIFSNSSGGYLKKKVNNVFNSIREEKKYVILVNSEQPEDSRFFASNDLFYWSGSLVKHFLGGILFMIAILVGIGLVAFLFRNYKAPAATPAGRKAARKVIWLILLGIVGLLFTVYLVALAYFKLYK